MSSLAIYIFFGEIFKSFVHLKNNCIYLFILAVLGLCCFSLAVVSEAYSLVPMVGLPIVVASLVQGHRFQGAQASVAAAPGL